MINSSTEYRPDTSYSTENTYVVRLKGMVTHLQKPRSTLEVLFNYGKAFLTTLLALIITALINEALDERFVFIFLGAVIVSAYWGGVGPGLLASLLSVGFINAFFSNSMDTTSRAENIFLPGVFMLLALFINWLEAGNNRTREKLTETKTQLELIFNGIMDGITVQDKDGQVIFANEAAATLLGYPSAAFMIQTPVTELRKQFEIFDEAGLPLPVNRLPARQVLANGLKAELTLRVKYIANGEERWLLIKSSPMFNHAKQPYLAINILQDITERRQAEQERISLLLLIEEQRRRLQNVFDNVPGIVWESKFKPGETTQEIVFISHFSETMLGYSMDDWLKDPDFWRKIIHPDDLEAVQKQATEIFNTGKPGTMEFRFIVHDGRVVPVEAPTTFLRNEANQAIGACGVFMDVSARKETEAVLAQSALELRRSNDELKQFAYVASHDLQEPLRMVGSYLQLIEKRYNDSLDTDGREFIAYAVDGANRMKALLNDLLAYSRVETSEKDLKQVNCQASFAEACQLLQLTIEDTGAVITSDPLPKVKGDEDLLRQLFQNLLGNSLKYRSDQPPNIHVGLKRNDKEWVFSVRDNGIGIEEQYLERIFVIFQRLHQRSKYPGTGIGLAICKKVVERHGGRIWAESKIGQGSTFYFTIPA